MKSCHPARIKNPCPPSLPKTPWSKPWALSESKTEWHLIVGEERNKLSGANLWWWSCKLGGGQERACKKEVGRLGTKWPISYYTCGLSFLLWKCAGMPMYQLHPGGAGGSYGAMFLDVLVPVCAWVCQIVCGQCWCLLWFGAREASQALGTRTPPHQYTGTSLWWRWGGGVSKMTQLEDGNVFWQALPGGVCLKLTFCPFPFSCASTISSVTGCSPCSSLGLSVVETWLRLHCLTSSFGVLLWAVWHELCLSYFASVQTRKECCRPGTLMRPFSD